MGNGYVEIIFQIVVACWRYTVYTGYIKSTRLFAMNTYVRKGALKEKTFRHRKAALLFAKLNGRRTIDLNAMKKGLCCKRGISTKWLFSKMKHHEKKSLKWTRRETFIEFIETLR